MPFRLVVRDGERRLAFPLREGGYLVGSADGCAVRLAHPTVSQRHARLTVAGDRLTVEDLGSRNGTRIDGEKVGEGREVAAGAMLAFGSQTARVEAVAARDLEPAMTFAPIEQLEQLGERSAAAGLPPATEGFGALSAFAIERLPALLARLEERPSRQEMASLVGESLFATLPCLRVEITARFGEDGEGLLYRAERDSAAGAEVAVPWRAGGSVRTFFPHADQGECFRPVLESAASLLRLATGTPAHRADTAAAGRPPLPDPPSVAPAVRRIYRDAARVALGDIGVLVTGESGTGKEILARFVHAASPRAGAPFVALNCAALPRDLLEAELFGVERGVATGVEARAGRFEQADGGTLFLDEIGDMAPDTQARILRVLQEGEVYRLGGQAPRSARVRVIAASNRDIDAMLEAGTFRSDLFHRIADWRVELPPLRERRADIPNLAAWFLGREAARHGLRIAGISRAALGVLEAHDWPGNVRQLEREMARAVLFLEEGQLLQSVHLQDTLGRTPAAPEGETLRQRLEAEERRVLEHALEAAAGNATAAAERLGVGRTTLYRRMKELGVVADRFRSAPGHTTP